MEGTEINDYAEYFGHLVNDLGRRMLYDTWAAAKSFRCHFCPLPGGRGLLGLVLGG